MVTKGERKYFSFAYLSLLFPLLSFCKDVQSEISRSVIEKISVSLKNESLGVLFLSGLLSEEKSPNESHIALVKRIAKQVTDQKIHNLDFLLSAENLVYTYLKAEDDKAQRKVLVETLKDLTNKIKPLISFNNLSSEFEALKQDQLFAGRIELLPTYDKISRFICRNFEVRRSFVAKMITSFAQKFIANEAAQNGNAKQQSAKTSEHAFLLLFSSLFNQAEFNFSQMFEALGENCQSLFYIMSPQSYKTREIKQASHKLESEFFTTISAQQPDANVTSQIYAQYILNAEKAIHQIPKLVFKIMAGDEESSVGELISSLKEQLEQADSVKEFKKVAEKIIACVCALPAGEPKREHRGLVFGLYAEAPRYAEALKQDLKEHTAEYVAAEIQSFVFEKLFQRLFYNVGTAELREIVGEWLELCGENNDLFAEALVLSEQLAEKGKENLCNLLLFCMFQNFLCVTKDKSTMLVNQVIEDLLQFAQLVAASENDIGSKDY